MQERWAKYKDTILNVNRIDRFTVDRLNKETMAYAAGDLKVSKDKPWVLYAGHYPLENFKTKPEAMQLAEAIVRGDYDLK